MDIVEEIKIEINKIKDEIKHIEEHCCNVELIKESIEARLRTNIALESILKRVETLEKKDQEVSNKIDNLYKVLYIGTGALIVFQTFILPNILPLLAKGG